MGNNLLNKAGETHLHSAGDKLPESIGGWFNSPGETLEEMTPLWASCILPGNNLILCRGILRLPGMLAEGYLYTLLENIKILWGYPTFQD